MIVSCTSREEVPFPAEEAEFAQPIIKPLKFGEPAKIQWSVVNPDSIRAAVVTPFDFSKAPSKRLIRSTFQPMPAPPEETKFDWNSLPDTAFDIDKLEEEPLRIKTSLLSKTQRIATALPVNKEGSSSRLFAMTTSQGLPSPIISDIIQGRNGLIWIICGNRLYSYNGEYLENYPIEGDASLLKITEDQSGMLWITTDGNKGIYILDVKAGIQRSITNIDVAKFTICEDSNGLFWVSMRNGVSIIDWEKKTIRKALLFKKDSTANPVFDVMQDHLNRIWLATDSDVRIINLHDKRMRSISVKQGLHAQTTVCLSEDKEGRVWVGELDTNVPEGIDVIDPASGSIRYIGKKQGLKPIGYHTVGDNRGNTYIACDSALYVVDKNLQQITRITDNERYADIWFGHIIIDKSGRIWKGTRSGGIVLTDTKGLMPEHLTKADGLSGESVWGIVKDNKGRMVLGGYAVNNYARSGWINRIDTAGNTITDLTKGINIPFNSIGGIREDKRGRIWACGVSLAIAVFDETKNTVTRIDQKQGLKQPTANCTLEDSRGMIWIGTDSGVAIIDSGLSSIRYMENYKEINNSRVYAIIEDAAKQLWISTTDNGVFMVDATVGFIYHFSTREMLGTDETDVIAEDPDGKVWVGTGKGILVINAAKKEYYTITSREGLGGEAAYSMEMAGGKVYIGTNNGISVLSPVKTEHGVNDAVNWNIKSYTKNHGLQYLDHNANSNAVNKDRIWLAADFKAVTIINQQDVDSLALPVYITELDILKKPAGFVDRRLMQSAIEKGDTVWVQGDNKFYVKNKFPADTGYLQTNNITWDSTTGPYNLPFNLQLPYSQNYFDFHFTSSDFYHRDKVRYRYILEGIDKSWSAISDKPYSENYRNLSSGKYTFKVCSRGANGVWSKPAELSFTILPPWWKTWWAWLAYAFIAALMIRGFIQYRSRWLKKENKRLEQMVTQRTDELSKSLEELKATQTQLVQSEKMASLGELTAGIAHEIQNPLNFVNNFTEVNTELIDEMKTAIDNGNTEDVKAIANNIKENNLKISHHGKRADSIVKGMLQHSRSSSNNIKEPTDINALVDEYLRLSYHGLRAKDKSFNVTLNTDFDKTIGKINIIPQDIGRVLLNLYNNAFYATNEKFKNQTEKFEPVVTVSTKSVKLPSMGSAVLISVKDNGNGIPQNIVDKIFQPFFTTKPTGQGTGLGLSLSYDIIKAQGGEIKVESKEGEGSGFTVILPAK